MTDVKWSALTAVTDLQDTDILSLVRSTANNKITGANLKAQIIADATNATQAELDAVATASVAKTLYDANTILKADSDNTPAALTMGASTILARLASGNIVAATLAEIKTLIGPTLPGYELAYNQITTTVSTTQTVEASAVTVVASSSVTYDGSTVVLIEVSASQITNSSGSSTVINLWEDSTDLGRIALWSSATSSSGGAPLRASLRRTPTAGAKVYTAKVWVSGSTGTVNATSPSLPAFIRITKV